MDTAGVPRVVVVTRPSELELLLGRHGTREQARFFLDRRGQSLEDVERRHALREAALLAVSQAVPVEWRRTRIGRADLSRFLFEPGDLVVAVGQDGLVANAAKYLSGQPVLGLNPDPDRYDGVLVPHRPEAAKRLLRAMAAGRADLEARTLVEALLDDGQRLLALNEIFAGHRSHQSARYRIAFAGREERQISSGVIVTTGTGATGWARSINGERARPLELPGPCDRALAFLVREPFPSVASGTNLDGARVRAEEAVELVSEMNEGGVLFGDGIEEDGLEFPFGARARLGPAEERLRLVRGA
ncbi:MAG TPA: NAD+ kinase [Anaeromyxobacteraceae bacterium]|nr:NAD+ kinase [Anaeromyxobacteraceae bacterium]